MPEISISFDRTPDDTVESQLARLSKIPFPKVWSAIAGLGIFYAVVITLLLIDHNLFTPFGIAICAAALATIALVPIGSRWETSRALRKLEAHLRQQFPGRTCIHQDFVFGDDGFENRCQCGTDLRSWGAVNGVTETPNLFLLTMPNLGSYVIPKRAFTAEQLAEFRELLARKIPQKK